MTDESAEGVGSGVTVVGDTAYVGDNRGNVYSVDVATGALRWTVPLGGFLGAKQVALGPLAVEAGIFPFLTLIAHLARSLGVRTALAGNIGLPMLELDDDGLRDLLVEAVDLTVVADPPGLDGPGLDTSADLTHDALRLGVVIALELPVQPSCRYACPFTAVRLRPESAAVAHWQGTKEHRHMVDAGDVITGVGKGDVARPARQIKSGRVK